MAQNHHHSSSGHSNQSSPPPVVPPPSSSLQKEDNAVTMKSLDDTTDPAAGGKADTDSKMNDSTSATTTDNNNNAPPSAGGGADHCLPSSSSPSADNLSQLQQLNQKTDEKNSQSIKGEENNDGDRDNTVPLQQQQQKNPVPILNETNNHSKKMRDDQPKQQANQISIPPVPNPSSTTKSPTILTTAETSSTISNQRNINLDVWNRVPDINITTTCTICNKAVGVSRFAQHLDKCMGIGKVRKSSVCSSLSVS